MSPRPGGSIAQTITPATILINYRQQLAALLRTYVQRGAAGQDQEERTWIYNEALLNHLYYRNQQYGHVGGDLGGISSHILTTDNYRMAKKQVEDLNPLATDYILPIFSGDMEKLVSVIGSRSPNAIGAPLIKGNQEQLVRARILNKVISYLRASQDIDNLHQQLVHFLCLYGTTFGRVEYRKDPKYGTATKPQVSWNQIPAFDPYYQCPYCGAETDQAQAMSMEASVPGASAQPLCSVCGKPLGPESLMEASDSMDWPGVSGEQVTERGATEFTLDTLFVIDIPFFTKKEEDALWLKRETLTPIVDLLQAYPDYRDPAGRSLRDILYPYLMGITGGTRSPATESTGSTGAEAELLTQSPSGQGYRAIPVGSRRHAEVWFHPKVYNAIPYDQSGELAEILNTQFPQGLKLSYVDALPVHISQEVLHKKWVACKATLSPYLISDPIMSGYRKGVDVINDFVNICVAAGEHSIPEVVYDGDLFKKGYLSKQPAQYGNWLEALSSSGRRISDMLDHIPGATISEYMMKFLEGFITFLRESIGITPALYGAGGGGQETARGREIQRNQALQQHMIRWILCKMFWERMYSNGAICIAENSGGALVTLNNGQASEELVPDVELLLQGGWDITMEESIPLTPGMQRDWLLELINNPGAYAVMSLVDPSTGDLVPQNLQVVSQMIGIPGWYIRNLDAYEGMMETIYQLTQEGSAPIEELGMDGQPFMLSSIPADTMVYPPAFAVLVLRGWLQSKEGRDMARENPLGYKNVKAHLSEYQMALQQSLAPPPGAEGEGGGGGEGGGEGGSPGGGGGGSSEGGGGKMESGSAGGPPPGPSELGSPAPGGLNPNPGALAQAVPGGLGTLLS